MPVSLLLLLLTMMMMMTLPNGVWMLPAPSGVFMESVDMQHTLRWRPPQTSCSTTVLYSVQYQGEFELEHQNGRWMDAPDCQQIPDTRCDLTSDLGSDCDYNIQVRVQCGSQRSAWTKLSRPFNRRQTNLTVPKMTVTTAGGALQVSFDSLPVTSTIDVTVWKKGDELQAVVHSMPAEQEVLHIADLQVGVVYCIRAQTVLSSALRSNSTAIQCVSITDPGAPAWKTLTTLIATVIIMAGLLFAFFWSIVHCRSEICKKYFQKSPLPQALRGNWDIQIPVSPQEKELCEQMVVDAALITHQD